ncbi:hypothetical protein NJ75_01571 [Novosphingobium subterraneum]|jgi:hypothetical protein|uniref:Uncharacterized protein n=1 Tax=Novosphingobium subterraneum TaxID=48936 RepID=A0A0B8ZN70_9SPHN|nr:hypothetical protein NJ75_01571 [Novosphingobium subterraneum]
MIHELSPNPRPPLPFSTNARVTLMILSSWPKQTPAETFSRSNGSRHKGEYQATPCISFLSGTATTRSTAPMPIDIQPIVVKTPT